MHLPCGIPSVACCGILALVTACSGEPNAPTCGDGVQDPDEACDDGNRESGDACTSTCQIPGTQLECTTLIEGTYYDWINALVALPDLSFVAAGSKDADGHQLPWIARHDDSGAQIWQTWPPPADEWTNSVQDLVADPSGGYWMLVYIGSDDELIHFDASGKVDVRKPMSALESMDWVGARRLLVVDDDVWLAGSGGDTPSAGPDLWVGRFDPETDTLSTIHIEDHVGFSDTIWAIARSESEIAVAATVDTSPSQIDDMVLIPQSDVLVIRFDRQGQEVGRHLLGSVDPETATTAYSIAADGGGGWIMGGKQHRPGDFFNAQEAWVASVRPSEGRTWTWTSGGSPSGDVVNDILVTEREVVAAGVSQAEGMRRAWLLGLGLDGTQHWEHTFDVQGYSESVVSAVVLDSAGRLRTANNSWNNSGETSLLQSCLVAW